MIRTVIKLGVLLVVGLVAYNFFLGTPEEKEKAKNALELAGKEVIELSENQALNFACNGLEVKDANGESCFILSKRAFDSLTQRQVETIEKFSKIVTPEITTIENIGGGSVRCMMAEIFLPYQRK